MLAGQSTPHFLFDLAEKKTGRTRKGYAASVSGKAANGCAVDGPKEKNAAAGRSAQSAYLRPPAGDGWPFLVSASSNAMPLGKLLARGGFGYLALLFPLALAWRLTRADEGVGPYGTAFVRADLLIRPYAGSPLSS